jgi:hypothetical protein
MKTANNLTIKSVLYTAIFLGIWILDDLASAMASLIYSSVIFIDASEYINGSKNIIKSGFFASFIITLFIGIYGLIQHAKYKMSRLKK